MTIYNLGGVPKDADTLDGLDSTAFATPAQISAAVAALVDAAPGTLDTLNELAAALGDDQNFATTVTTALSNKAEASALALKVDSTDARLSDARTPTAHAASHATGGTDAVTPAAIGAAAASHTHAASAITSGTVDVARLPVGTTAGTIAAGDDPRFVSGATPAAHAASHGTTGSDPISPASIGAATATALTTHASAAAPHSGHESTAAKNTANGYAGLDAAGKVATSQLPTVPLTAGGTGQTTKAPAFNALSPLTTKGDLVVHDGTNSVRLPVGTNEMTLVADSTQTGGVRWSNRARVVASTYGGGHNTTTAKTQLFTLTIPAASLAGGTHVQINFWGTLYNSTGANINHTWEFAGPNAAPLASAATACASSGLARNVSGQILYNLINKNATTGWDQWMTRLTVAAPGANGLVSETANTNYPLLGTTGSYSVDTTGSVTFSLSCTMSVSSANAGFGFIYAQAVVIN